MVIKIFMGSTNHQAEPRNQSPIGLKPFDLGGVGLGIVAALGNSGDDPNQIPASKPLFSRNLSRRKQVPIHESYTKVHGQSDFRLKNIRASVFHISTANNVGSAGEFPASDFLSSCSMCRKKLHGQDIYMYRGEKAFCSSECRYDQIVIDERKEKYYSKEASRQAVVDVSSSSPCVNGQKKMFAAEILAS